MIFKRLSAFLFSLLFLLINQGFSQWQVQDPGFPEDEFVLFSYPANDSVVWAVGGVHTDTPGSGYQGFSITKDGGLTWQTNTIEMAGLSDYNFTSIFALNDSVAWVSMVDYISNNHQGRILKTTDGGNTWVHQSTAYPFHATLAHIPTFVHFFDENNGICAGHFGEMYYTSNGGELWIQVPADDYPSLIANEKPLHSNVSSVGDSIAWYGTSMGRIFKTTNKGRTWSAYNVGLGQSYLFASFKDELNGLATTPIINKKIAKTTDGGETWQTLPNSLPVNAILINVKGTENTYMYGSGFLPSAIGSASGSGFTDNDGVSWYDQDNLNLDPMVSTATGDGWTGWATASWSDNKLYKRSVVSALSDNDLKSPDSHQLYQNHPNPFNPVTKIKYEISVPGYVSLELFDLQGRKIRLLENGYKTAGVHETEFTAENLSSGVYIYTLRTGNFTQSKKLVLLK